MLPAITVSVNSGATIQCLPGALKDFTVQDGSHYSHVPPNIWSVASPNLILKTQYEKLTVKYLNIFI